MQKSPINAHADVISGARGLNFGLNHRQYPYFVYASREGKCTDLHEPALLDYVISRKNLMF